MRVCLLALFLAACGGGDSDFRNGYQDEAYVDPGPGEIAAALASSYADPTAPSSAAEPARTTMRGALIWREREDGNWVYVERDLEDGTLERAVYGVDYEGDRYVARVFGVLETASVDLEGEPVVLDSADVVARDGCAVVFERTGPGDYAGSTAGAECPASPGASHTAIDVVLEDGRISVWEREVTPDGQRVAGPPAPDVYERVDGR
ncbi:CpcT/CpeT family chromophore lyase [Rubrivirga sp.]|uniref:CpcT/CpeT family chromophore lyase n=1 Tax=Rubrivirga sp. TaxID=1885344 RepID=UPI003C729219